MQGTVWPSQLHIVMEDGVHASMSLIARIACTPQFCSRGHPYLLGGLLLACANFQLTCTFAMPLMGRALAWCVSLSHLLPSVKSHNTNLRKHVN